jgi:hypothetical protein
MASLGQGGYNEEKELLRLPMSLTGVEERNEYYRRVSCCV